VIRYSDIQLDKLVEDDDEFYKLENAMYEAISEGLLRGIYRFSGSCRGNDLIVVSPEPLSREVLNVVDHLAGLYQFRLYDGSGEMEEVTKVLHNFIKMQASGCLEAASPAKAVYSLAKTYGLAIQKDAQLDDWHGGKIIYKIEGLDKSVVKEVYYCNRCMSFHDDEEFIEKCRSWRFVK